MNSLASDKTVTNAAPASAREPLSGEKLASAVEAMKLPEFLPRLTALIMKLAKRKGFKSPFNDSMELPGGKSAMDLANDIIEKALDGSYNWNTVEIPDFTLFCLSRAESILSNWLDRTKWNQSMSPLLEKNSETGAMELNPLNRAVDADDIYGNLRIKDGAALGDRFLEDFALSLTDGSTEQRMILAVFDDRECGSRSYCCGKLNISGDDYDAAKKRLLRRLPAFAEEWRATNKVSDIDWKEAQ